MVGGDFNFAVNVLPGDMNQDGIVNAQDIAVIASRWLQTGGITGDTNGDDIDNAQDIALIASHWLATLPAGGAEGIASVAGADSQVAAMSIAGQSTPATNNASAVAVNTVVPASATSLSVGTRCPQQLWMRG